MIKAALGFWPNLWQINGLLDIKNGRNIVILAKTRLGKSLLFQVLSIIKINAIVLVIIPILALIKDQL